jgi:hypothetical protein
MSSRASSGFWNGLTVSPGTARRSFSGQDGSTSADSSRILKLMGPCSYNALNRSEAVGQRCGTRLQDQRRLDLVETSVLNRGDTCETRSCGDPLRPEFLAAPGADDHIWPAGNRLIGKDNGFLGRGMDGSIGEDVAPPAISINSDTHPIPVISGSSHSSKNTLGRRGSCSAWIGLRPAGPRACQRADQHDRPPSCRPGGSYRGWRQCCAG